MTSVVAFSVALLAIAALLAVLALAIAARRLTRRLVTARAQRRSEPIRPMLLMLAAGDDDEADAMVAALLSVDERTWEALTPTVVGLLGKLHGHARDPLVSLLERRGALPTARRNLASRRVVLRAAAAELLGLAGDLQSVPGLVALLQDREPEVRQVAARALGRIGDPRAAAALLQTIEAPRGLPARLVSQALLRIGAVARAPLEDAAHDASELVRAVAVEILGLTDAIASFDTVRERLVADDAVEVRIRAARALGRLGLPAGLEPLLDATEATEPLPLRTVATRALGDLGRPEAVDRLRDVLVEDTSRISASAAHALVELGTRGTDALTDVATSATVSPDARLRAREALALAELRAPARMLRERVLEGLT